MNYLSRVAIVPLLVFANGLHAQNAPESAEPPEVPADRVSRLADVQLSPFRDPGNAAAKKLADQAGISVGEATSEMRRTWALNQFILRLRERNPDLFSFVRYEGQDIVIGMTNPNADVGSLLPPGLGNVRFTKTEFSDRASSAELRRITDRLQKLGITNFSVSHDSETGAVEFITKSSRDAIAAALDSGELKINGAYTFIDDEITVSGTLYAGASWNVDTSCRIYCNLTTGFSMMSTGSDATRYVTTAAHAENYRARFNQGTNSTYSSGGNSLSSRQELYSLNIDVEYAVPSSPSTNPPGPYYWDGTAYQQVYGAIYPTDIIFCKYGRVTGETCGMHHDPAKTFSNSIQGYAIYDLARIDNNASEGTNMIREGDSGGPVYRGTYAAGWIHGRDSSYNVYYSTYKAVRAKSAPIDLIVYY